MNRGIVTAVVGSLLALSTISGPTAAANPHFVGNVSFKDLGTQLQATGSVAGLGNENIDVRLSATGIASIECKNPAGNVAPGQSKTVSVSGSQSNLEVKNGRVSFSVTTGQPVAPAGSCPNPQWTASVIDVRFRSATLTIIQPAGSNTVVLQQNFTP